MRDIDSPLAASRIRNRPTSSGSAPATPQVAAFVLVLIALCTTGCNVLGYAASGIAGSTKSPAVFTPAKTPLVVIAENFENPADAALDAEPIARYISEELRTNAVAPMVDPDKVFVLQAQNAAKYRGMTIAAVGREVGAEQILYVNIIKTTVTLADQSDMIRGSGEAQVRLIDAASGATIWPTGNAEGYPVAVETRVVRRDERSDVALRTDVHRSLATRTARLFYPTSN